MRDQFLPKIAVVIASSLLSVLVVSGSIAWVADVASTRAAAGKEIRPVLRVSSKQKRRRTVPRLVAQVTQPRLLPMVEQADLTVRHEELADAVLRALPPHCRMYLKNFHVLYKDAKQRGLGGKTTIILDGQHSDEEFVGLLIHECAHVTHGNMQGGSTSGESAYRDGHAVFYNDSPIISFFAISWSTENVLKTGTTKSDFVSGYARSDAFEDFAETFAAYVLHRPMLRERAQVNASIASKLEWMERHLPLEEETLGQSTYAWDGVVPWDVTKLPLNLRSTLVAKR